MNSSYNKSTKETIGARSVYAPDPSFHTVIKTYDNLSLFRSIVVGRLRDELNIYLRKYSCTMHTICANIKDMEERGRALYWRREYQIIIRNLLDRQKMHGVRLMEKAGLSMKTEYNMDDVRKLQEFLAPTNRLHVFELNTDTKKTTPVFAGDFRARINIILVYDGHTFYLPKSIRTILNAYYCVECCGITRHKYRHRCPYTCAKCGQNDCRPGRESIHCDKCQITFNSQHCYQRHLQGNRQRTGNRCANIKLCIKCGSMYSKENLGEEEHICENKVWCAKCQKRVAYRPMKNTIVNHPCYWALPGPKKKEKARKEQNHFQYIVYDMECVQNTIQGGKLEFTPKHKPCCIVVRKVCYKCVDTDINEPCTNCEERERIFTYNNSTDVLCDFANYLVHPRHNKRIVMAHCGGRYDHFILLRELIKMKIYPKLVMRGRTILQATIKTRKCNLVLKDTYALIPIALCDMKKAFALDTDDKGTWPYLFTDPANYHLEMKGLPALKYYNPGGMKPDKREQLLKWHNTHDETYTFNFDQELVAYCQTDTEILLKGVIAYQRAMIIATGWNPVVHSMTLASFTNFVLRFEHFTGKQIGHIPENGLSKQRQQSEKAVKWLEWTMFKEGIHIQHAYNGEEKRITVGRFTYSVDGWCEQTKKIYEYYGCYWHGHKGCYEPGDRNRCNGELYGDLYEQTMFREQNLIDAGYEVESVWECNVKEELQMNREMEAFFDTCQVGGKLHPRIAMQGGRTEALKTKIEADEENEIVYLDYTSLYPSVMVDTEYPLGFPEVLVDGFTQDDLRTFPFKGLGHVTILPPTNLQYPLLAVKMRMSLLFTLCRMCSLQINQGKCHHNEEQRALTCTWTHLELLKAISLGYRILKIHEVWRWDEWDSTLFHKYVKTFFIMKQEASGWPEWVNTEEDKIKYVTNYKEEMGLQLDPSKIEFNAALRFVTKQLLNSSWGKFAQKADQPIVKYVDYDELFDLMRSTHWKLRSHHQMNLETFIATYSKVAEEVHSPAYGSLPIGIFVTSKARLQLYRLLELSKGSAAYTDTDSIIALVPRGDNPFASIIGDGLGKLTSEVPKGFEIKKVVINGPKQYAIRMMNDKGEEKIIIKIRGSTLDYDATQLISFDKLEHLAKDEEIKTSRLYLKRNLHEATISTVVQEKRYKKVNNKNVLRGTTLYPFGYDGLEDPESDIEQD